MLHSDGGMEGWVGTLADITAEAGAEAAMAAARDEATKASQLKSDFLANMSHEIRTPMNGVIGMTDLLLETDLGAVQRDYAQTVRNSGEALLTIINDILDYSKVEAGMLEVEALEFSLRAVVDDVIDLLAGSAQTKGLELVVQLESAIPALVTGDPGRVRQVLTNLVGNAIKFTRAGEIVVRVTMGEPAGDDIVVRFDVSDTGDGISQDKLCVIFAPFVQADTSTSRRYGGTGLGLAISRQLVGLMGGEIGVSSELGQGSTFWFTIGVHSGAGESSQVLDAPDAGLAGLLALIVDDNATQRSVLSEHLTGWGMTVATADSGPAALATLRAAAVDGPPIAMVLIDRSMPDMDGLELTDAIVGDATLSPRLVLMTGLGQERSDDAQSGVCATVSKPVHAADLQRSLRIAAGLQVADEAPPLTVTGSPSPSVEPSDQRGARAGRLLLAEDNLINQKVAVAMLSSAGYQVDTVLDGAAAVRAVAAQPYDVILMDCQMPELNGYEATAAIRAHEGADRHTPIIALTAGARREDRERCLAEGMDGYLAKPISKDALLALVARSLNRGTTSVGSASLVGHTSAAEFAIDHADFDELRLLAEATEHDFVTELIDQFFHDTDLMLVALRDASSRGDAAGVGHIAHSIRGSGAQLGGRRLALSCGQLESTATGGGLSNSPDDLIEVERDYAELRDALTEQRVSVDRQLPGGPRV